MMLAAILVGGKGTRLSSLISNVPKPLAPINGEPFLFLLLRKLAALGIRDVILLTGYCHEQIQAACGTGSQFNLGIHYSRELQPLGTAGALRHAAHFLKKQASFLLLNGDTYLDCPLEQIINYSLKPTALGVIGAMAPTDSDRFGNLAFDTTTMQITAFREKSRAVATDLVNAGIYKLATASLDYITADGFVSLEETVLPALVANNKILDVLPLQGNFYDIGLPSSYANFNVQQSLQAVRQQSLCAHNVLLTLLRTGNFWMLVTTLEQTAWSAPLQSFYNTLQSCCALPHVSSQVNLIISTQLIRQAQVKSSDCGFIDETAWNAVTNLNHLTNAKLFPISVIMPSSEKLFPLVQAAWHNIQPTLAYHDLNSYSAPDSLC